MTDGERIANQGEWLQLLVRHLMGRRLRAASEPDDVVQEIVLRALQATPLPEGEAALKSWLRRLARNVVVDLARHLRARGDGGERRLAHSEWSRSAGSGVVLSSPERGPLTRAGLAEDRRLLVEAYDALSAEHRRVIGLRQFRGHSAAECGRRMGRSESAIHSLYRRALQAWAEGARS